MCVYTGQYMVYNVPDQNNPGAFNKEEFYCNAGKWSSRTKLVGLAMLSQVSPILNYTLYCGAYSDTLNYVDYWTNKTSIDVKGVFDGNNQIANNLCVLDYQNKIIIGTSFNKNLSVASISASIKEIIPSFDKCNLSNGTGFVSCDATNRAWYNRQLNIIISSNTSFVLSSNIGFDSVYSTFVENEHKFTNTVSILENRFNSDPFSYSFVNSEFRFNRFYLARKGSKKVFSVFGDYGGAGAYKKSIVERYENFTSDLCKVILGYNESHSDESGLGVGCIKQLQNYYILAIGGDELSRNPSDAIWPDISGKLRIK
jgi:hypothetical protein